MKLIHFLLLFIFSNSFLFSQEMLDLLGTWQNDDILENVLDARYNEIWGMHINDNEYAIIGTTLGTHFIDINDPQNPVEKFIVQGKTIGQSIIHRDYHDYNGFLYAVSDEGNQSTLQIIDCNFLPDSVHVVYDSHELIKKTHNIFIDSSSAKLYSLSTQGSSLSYAAMRIFDISEPSTPSLLGSYSSFNGYSINHVHDAYVRNDTAYLNCGNDGFLIVDFIDVDNPNTIVILEPSDYPQSGYNHSGWLSDDGNHYIMADETWGKAMKILDVSDLPEISVIGTLGMPNNPDFQIPHNQIIKGNYLYGAYYYDGLQIWDISNIENVTRAYEYPTSNIPHQKSYHGNWGVYPFFPSGLILASDLQEGLFVFGSIEPKVNVQNTSISIERLEVFPNPCKEELNISLSSLKNPEQLFIFQSNGRMVHSQDIESNQKVVKLDIVSQLSEGVYFVEVKAKNKNYRTKIIVQ